MVISASSNPTRLVRRLGSALIATLFVVAAAGMAEAETLKTVVKNSDGSVTTQYSDPKSHIVYLTSQVASGCGSISRIDLGAKPPTTITYQFPENGDNGCNPVKLEIIGDFSITVTTDQGGTFNNGTENSFDPETLAPGAMDSFSPYETPAVTQSDRKALKPTPRTSTNIFVTGNNAVYELTVGANGSLSAPTLIHGFSTSGDGGFAPYGQAVLGADGNLYGTTEQGGAKRNGVVYRLTPVTVGTTTTWTYTVLYTFRGKADGGRPIGDIAIDQLGNLYGTTSLGGMIDGAFAPCGANGFPGPVNAGCGVVFELINKGATAPWTERVLWTFSGGADGATPEAGVVLDAKGRIYGTTFAGGNTSLAACSGSAIQNADPGCGVVFELSGPKFHRTESVLYTFTGSTDGAEPMGPVQLAGKDIYGSTAAGGDTTDEGCNSAFGVAYANGCGVVFELTP